MFLTLVFVVGLNRYELVWGGVFGVGGVLIWVGFSC